MPNILDWADFPTQDRLYELKWFIRDGAVNEGFDPPEINHLFWATCTEGRYMGRPFMWMAELFTWLADTFDIQLCLDEMKDSLGDFLAVNGLWNGEAA